MIDLKQWVDRNANRPLAYAVGTVLLLQVGYLAYLAHDEYSARLRRIERMVETASLGIQQNNRPLIEATLITGLRNSDASTVALCRADQAELLYPPSHANPCRTTRGGLLHWTVRRSAVGLDAYEFIFVVDSFTAFAPLAVLLAITAALSLAVILILLRARERFASEILGPLRQGLTAEAPLAISELDELRRRNQEHIALSRRRAVTDALFDFSAQVAHDMRSPLAVLEAVSDAAAGSEDKRATLRGAISRLRGIADSILSRYRTASGGKDALLSEAASLESTEASAVSMLSSLIAPIVTEKPIEFGQSITVNAEYDVSSFGLFAGVQPVEFARVLSNLINNAAEALEGGRGRISVALSSTDGQAVVRVTDDGKGIPPEVLSKLGSLGASHGKKDGHGRGLHHARSSVEAWGGRLEIESSVSRGTTVTLFIPRADAPDWFALEIAPLAKTAVVALDDDPGVHGAWRKRFDEAKAAAHGVRLCEFRAPEEARRWIAHNPVEAKRAFFLLDYELGDGAPTGLDLAAELGLRDRAVLVTGRHDDDNVKERCRKAGIRLLPKELIHAVPIRVRDSESPQAARPVRLDAVLIDDDPLTRMTWQNAAAELGKSFRAFSSLDAFVRESPGIGLRSPVYIDAKLGGGVNGAEESLRIRSLGFDEIYLATGHPPEAFTRYKHLRGVVGKEPPWSGVA